MDRKHYRDDSQFCSSQKGLIKTHKLLRASHNKKQISNYQHLDSDFKRKFLSQNITGSNYIKETQIYKLTKY